MFTCSFLNCETTLSDKNLGFYLFPVDDEEILKKWIEALGYPEDKPYVHHKDNFICSKHFNPEDISDGILRPNAVPMTEEELADEVILEVNDSKMELSDFDICRICGKAKEILMYDIFDDDHEVCEKIGMCLPIVINPNDNLPQTICDECFDQLDVAANLIKKCMAGEEKLNSLFGPQKITGLSEGKRLPLDGPIVCDDCQVYFTDMTLFDVHMVEHEANAKPQTNVTGRPSVVCTDCGYIYPDWKLYDSHKSSVKSSCNQCTRVFSNKCGLNQHKCERYKCEICGLILRNESAMRKHIDKSHRHPLSKELHDFENATTPVPDVLKANIKKHTKNRKELYHCNICDIKFTSNKKLRDHCVEFHGTPNVLWICKFCGKSMTTKVSLQIHERIHYDSKPYICEWCGNGYRSRANLNQHQVIHTGVRNHECPKCGKRFSRKAFVRTHMRVHTGERPYVCDICGHRFTQLGDMKRHSLFLSKVFGCSSCDALKKPKKTLHVPMMRNRHQNPHVPAYPSDRVYACDFCGQSFTQLSVLKKHRMGHSLQQQQERAAAAAARSAANSNIITDAEVEEATIEIEQVDDHLEIETRRRD